MSQLSHEEMLKMKRAAVRKFADGKTLTYDETRYAIWDPKSGKKPLSCMGVLKIERKALGKLKTELAKYGIQNLDDVLEPKHRQVGEKSFSGEQ